MKFSDLSKDIDLRIEIPHLDLSLDVTASPNKPLSDIMKDIARALKQSRPGETHEKYLSKMNLRCPARMNSTWLSPDSNLRTYESLFSFNWRLEFFTKKVKIHIGFESVTVNIDLRKPMSYVLRQLAKKYRIISPDEYGFLATISSKKLKDLKEENTKLATIAQKHWKEMEKQNLKGKDEDARFWLDLNRSFSDNPLMIINPDARISLSRMIFYNYNAITAQNMHEAAILFEQLRDMAASNHFTSLTNKLALSLLQLAISIEYAGRLDKITPKSLDQSKYLPKDKFVSHKQILTDIQRYSAKSTIELQYNYLDILRSLPEWGKECFYVKDMKEKKNCTLEISKKGVNIVPSNAKKGDTGQLYSFNRIQSFKYLDTTMTIKISNGQILSYQTEEGYKIATALSSYIDCEKGNKKVQKILLPTEAKAKSEQIASISFVRNIRQDAPDITNTTSQLNSANSRRRMLARLMKNTDMDLFGMLHYGMTNSHVSKMQVGSSTEKGTVSNWMDDLQQLIANLNKSQKTDITAPKDVLLGESEKMFHNTSNSHALNQTSGSIFEFQSSINPDSSLEDVIKSLHGVEQYINSLIGTGVIADSFNDSDNSALYSKIIPLCDFISPAQRGSQKNHDLFDKILEILEKIRDSSKQYDSGLIDYAELQVSQAALMESLTKIKIEFDSKLKKLPDQEDLEKICGMLSDLCAILATNPLIALNSAGSAQFAAKTQQLSSFIANMKSSKKTINELLRQLRSILNDPVEPTASSYSESCMSPRFAAYFEDVISTGDSKNFAQPTENLFRVLSSDQILLKNSLLASSDSKKLLELLDSVLKDLEEAKNEDCSAARVTEIYQKCSERISTNRVLLTSALEKRDVLKNYESLNRLFTLLSNSVSSIPASVIPEEHQFAFVDLVSTFTKADMYRRAVLYNTRLLEHLGDSDERVNLLDISLRAMVQTYTECLAKTTYLIPLMTPKDNSIQSVIDELAKLLGSEIANQNTMPHRSDLDPSIVMSNVYANQMKSLEGKNISELKNFIGSLDLPQTISQHYINLAEEIMLVLGDYQKSQKPFDVSQISLQSSALLLVMKKAMACQENESKADEMLQANKALIKQFEILSKTSHSKQPVGNDELDSIMKELIAFGQRLSTHAEFDALCSGKYTALNKQLSSSSSSQQPTDKTKASIAEKLSECSLHFANCLFAYDTLCLEAPVILKSHCDALTSIINDLKSLDSMDGDMKACLKSSLKESQKFFDVLMVNYVNDKVSHRDGMMDYMTEANQQFEKLSAMIDTKLGLKTPSINTQHQNLFTNLHRVRQTSDSSNCKDPAIRKANLIEIYAMSNNKIHDCKDSAKVLVSSSEQKSVDDLESHMVDLGDMLASLKRQTERYNSSHQIIVKSGDLTAERFVTLSRKATEGGSRHKTSVQSKIELDIFVQRLNSLLQNIAGVTNNSTSRQINRTSKTIDEHMKELQMSLNNPEADNFEILHKLKNLELLIKEQACYTSKRPCIANNELHLSDKQAVDRAFTDYSFIACDLANSALTRKTSSTKDTTIESPAKLYDQYKTLSTHMLSLLNSMNPIILCTNDLNSTIDDQLLPLVIVSSEYRAQLVDEASKDSQNLDHFIESRLAAAKELSSSILVQHKFLINCLQNAKSPGSVNAESIIDAFDAIKYSTIEFIKVNNSVISVSDTKESDELNKLLEKLLIDLQKASDEACKALTNSNLQAHDYSGAVAALQNSAKNFGKVEESSKLLLNEFKALQNAKNSVMESRLHLKNLRQAESCDLTVLHSNFTKATDSIAKILGKLVENLNSAPQFITDAEYTAELYENGFVKNCERSNVSLKESNIEDLPGFNMDKLMQLVDSLGESLCGAFDAKIESAPDSNLLATQNLQAAQKCQAEILQITQTLSKSSQLMSYFNQRLREIKNHLSGSVSAAANHHEEEKLNSEQSTERVNKLRASLDEYSQTYQKLEETLIEQKQSGVTQENEKALEENIESILGQSSPLYSEILNFYSIVFNDIGDKEGMDFQSYCSDSMLTRFVSSQTSHMERVHAAYSSGSSVHEMKQGFEDIAGDSKKLSKSLKNIQNEQFSRQTMLGRIIEKTKQLKSDFDNSKIKTQSITIDVLEESELFLLVAVDSLVKNLAADSTSEIATAAGFSLTSLEGYVPTALSAGIKAENNIKEGIKSNLGQILDHFLDMLQLGLVDDGTMDNEKVVQNFNDIELKLKEIMDLVNPKTILDEEAERLRREKIEKTNKKVKSVLDKYNEFKLRLRDLEISEEIREIYELLIKSIDHLYDLLLLHSVIMEELHDESPTGLRTMATQAIFNNYLADTLTIHIDSAEYFVTRKKDSKVLLANSNLNCIATLVFKLGLNNFIKIKAPQYHTRNIELSQETFNLMEQVEAMLKKNAYEDSEMKKTSVIKDTIKMFQLHNAINVARDRVDNMFRRR